MIDNSTPIGRAVAAALRLAEKQPWATVTLLDIADEAGLTLVELSRHVASKGAILRAFVRLVDDEVLRTAERREPGESLRERLFDVLMTRLETMAPYKAGLKRIAADAAMGPELIGSVLRSQRWMLTAAGIPSDGISGVVRTTGLASVYAATFRDWLDDDDAGLARTMAALDRRLRRGEGWMRTFSSAEETIGGMTRRAREMFAGGSSRRTGSRAPMAEAAPSTAEATMRDDGTAAAEADVQTSKSDVPVADSQTHDEDDGKPRNGPTSLH